MRVRAACLLALSTAALACGRSGLGTSSSQFVPVPGPGVSTSTLLVSVNGGGQVVSTPSGIDCPAASCQADFVDGTQVTLLPTPDSGNVFDLWGGACSGPGPCTPVLLASTSVSANFRSSGGG